MGGRIRGMPVGLHTPLLLKPSRPHSIFILFLSILHHLPSSIKQLSECLTGRNKI
jgi:hypothetical protein